MRANAFVAQMSLSETSASCQAAGYRVALQRRAPHGPQGRAFDGLAVIAAQQYAQVDELIHGEFQAFKRLRRETVG